MPRSTFAPIAALLILSAIASAQPEATKAFSLMGIAFKVSSLGAGVEVATPITLRSNLRAGFNMFRYDRNFHKDGVSYAAQLRFLSTEVHYDWFPFAGSFHLSPGVVVYNGNKISANASVPGGKTFTLNDTDYTSDPANPIAGTGRVDFVKAGPMFTVGWGNLLPRSRRHFSVPFELGAMYTGAPHTALNFGGGACDANGQNCTPINSDPTFQANVQDEKAKLDKDMSAFKFYPILSIGFAFNF